MNKAVAFFNVCTCEGYGSVKGATVRGSARRIQPQLNRLFDFAKASGIVVVSTRCGQGGKASPIGPMAPVEMLVVPPEATHAQWKAKLPNCSQILLERQFPAASSDDDSTIAYDAFHTNLSANDLVQSLDIKRWIVFGVWLQSCVAETARGLRQLGKQVTVLSDAVLPGDHLAICPNETLEDLQKDGVVIETTDQFLGRFLEETGPQLAAIEASSSADQEHDQQQPARLGAGASDHVLG